MNYLTEKFKSCCRSNVGSSVVFALILISCVIAVTSSLLLSASSVVSVVKSEQNIESSSSAVNSAIKMFRQEVSELSYSASYTLITEYDEKNQSTVSYLSDEGFIYSIKGAGRFDTVISDMISCRLNPASEKADDNITAVYLISLSPNNYDIRNVRLTLSLEEDYTLSALFEAIDESGSTLSSGIVLDYFTVSSPTIHTNENHYKNYIYETREEDHAELVIGAQEITEHENIVEIFWNDAVVHPFDAK